MSLPAHAFARLPLALAALSLCLGTLPAGAADHVAPAKAAKAADSQLAQAAAAESGSLDAIRDKIALKLGGGKALDAKTPHLVRVASRATGELQVAPARAGARAAAGHAAAAPAAAAKAVAHHGAVGGHAPWSYEGTHGPQAWASMSPDFAKCATGTRQSPIDIRGGIHVDLEPVRFDYKSSGFAVIDNGHTVQVNVGGGNSIEVMGRHYELVQFHFHRPSEERIDGRQFDMVVHLVHQDLDGRLAVVAVLLDRGSAQPIVQAVWNNLPLEKGEELAARATIDLNHLLPQDRRYYTYMGSLTTPPCSEGVLWMVLQQPVTVSPEQIDIFAQLYPMNARPIQAAAGRLIKGSN